MPVTTVVNLNKDQYDVYIGRAGQGLDGFFGNPFRELPRSESIQKFKEYFFHRIADDPAFRQAVHKLKGKRLGCFCSPKPCHGDIIADYLNNLTISTLRLGVVGSRTFSSYSFLCSVLNLFDIQNIVSGGAKGADSLAAQYARENNIALIEHLPDWNQFGKSAGFIRNQKIIDDSDEIIAFWDGLSKGTKHSIDLAQNVGKIVRIYWPFSKELTNK